MPRFQRLIRITVTIVLSTLLLNVLGYYVISEALLGALVVIIIFYSFLNKKVNNKDASKKPRSSISPLPSKPEKQISGMNNYLTV